MSARAQGPGGELGEGWKRRMQDQVTFLVDLQTRFYDEMYRFYREDCGYEDSSKTAEIHGSTITLPTDAIYTLLDFSS